MLYACAVMEVLRIYWRFLKLGFLAFGGPFPQIAMLQRELVEKEKWTTHSRFNRVLAVYQALPGPEATEMCVWLGACRAGRPGAVAAGLGFLTPGSLLVVLCAWLYTRTGLSPVAVAALAGAQVGALALLFNAARTLGLKACTDSTLVFIALAACGASLAGMHFAAVLMMGAAAGYFTEKGKNWLGFGIIGGFVFFCVLVALWLNLSSAKEDLPVYGTAINAGKGTELQALLSGLKAGAFSFGGAYTAVPFLRDDALKLHDWMTHGQFMDGLAIVSALPTPLVSVAGFVGLLAGGWWCAAIMLVAVYVPAFAFTLLGHGKLERIVENEALHSTLDGVTAAVVGMVGATAIAMVKPIVLDQPSTWLVKGALLVVGLALAVRFRGRWTGPAIVLGAAAVGALALRG